MGKSWYIYGKLLHLRGPRVCTIYHWGETRCANVYVRAPSLVPVVYVNHLRCSRSYSNEGVNDHLPYSSGFHTTNGCPYGMLKGYCQLSQMAIMLRYAKTWYGFRLVQYFCLAHFSLYQSIIQPHQTIILFFLAVTSRFPSLSVFIKYYTIQMYSIFILHAIKIKL